MSGPNPVSFEEHVLRELVRLQEVAEVLLEKAGVEYTPRSEVPGVLSLAHAVADLVQPALDEIVRRQAVQVSTPTVRHVVRDDQGEITQVIELPASYVTASATVARDEDQA